MEQGESINKESIREIENYLSNPKLASVSANILLKKSEKLIDIARSYRIFRNSSGIFYQGVNFESIDMSLEKYIETKTMFLLEDSDVVINKDYLEEDKKSLQQKSDILDIGLRKTRENNEILSYNLHKSIILGKLQEGDKANQHLIRALDTLDKMESTEEKVFNQEIIKKLYQSLLEQIYQRKNYESGKELALVFSQRFPQDYHGFYYAAKFFIKLEDKEKAKRLLNEALGNIERTYLYRLGKPAKVVNDEEVMKELIINIENEEILNSSEYQAVSFYMIVKNEEKYLEKCLNSVSGMVDEIIIVDTGSTDNSLKIAEQFEAKVINHKWEKDFSKARNIALKNCSHPWIFTLDADEELEKVSIKQIKALTLDPDIIAYTLIREDLNDKEGEEPQIGQLYRFFQNLKDINYKLPIYESISESVAQIRKEKGMRLGKSKIKIKHYGYTNEAKSLHNTFERNQEIIQEALKAPELNDKDKVLLFTKLAVIYNKNKKELSQAQEYANRGLDIINKWDKTKQREYATIVELYDTLADICRQQEDYEKALNYCKQGLEVHANAPTLIYKKAFILFLQKNYEQSIEVFHECLALGRNNDYYALIPFKKGILSYISLFGIGSCYVNLEKYALANVFFEQTLEENENYKPAQNAMDLIKDDLSD